MLVSDTIKRICDPGARVEGDQWLTRLEFAALARVHESTLYRWARQGIGPQAHRMGPRLVRYSRREVVAWLESPQSAS